jgi:hypothetical protein
MLPLAGSPRLTVLGREVRLGTGYADLLAVESTGRVVIIDVKLAGNSEARRAVVAQVLSYAGYLQGLDPDQLETQILAPYLGTRTSVLAAAQSGDQQHALDPEAFKDGLAHSLAEGSFRLVIVLDSAPDELVQVVGYLQSVTDKIDIDLVTVASYDVAGSQVLVPQRVEPARRVHALSDAQVDARQAGALNPGSSEFREVIAGLPVDRRDQLLRVADWADALASDGLISVAMPVCSDRSHSVARLLKTTRGPDDIEHVASTSGLPSPVAPVRARSLSATLLAASRTAWK